MIKTKDVLVIGLGRFGSSIVETLLEKKQRVTVVDMSEQRINKFSRRAEYAKVCDTRNEEVLEQLGVNNFDHVVVAIGSSIESSIITTLLLKDMGVNNITVKASNFQHKSALLKLGIAPGNIIMPEHEMGHKVALTITVPIVADYVSLIGKKYSIIETFPNKTSLSGHNIKDLDIKRKFNVTIAAIKRDDEVIIPDSNTIIGDNDSLIVIGEDGALNNFEQIL
ncbi:trk system potassium uptake protein TrkA [Bacilli bacterium PM5-3]|nr:trk system potassium uptake protein TrkA [Bacilli bacterium PM5-3]MDH6603027.1 trk system potassium uptake protein TrkA [Bacilli bacterium PM5-9]